jgi:TRAP-type mannitol/chloroaromatic compound transport system substrate-binding protein
VYVNAKAWEFLPNDYEQIFEMTRSDAHVEMQAKYDARNRDALRRLVCYGVKVRHFPRDNYAELSEWSANWKKIYTSFVKFRDNQIL